MDIFSMSSLSLYSNIHQKVVYIPSLRVIYTISTFLRGVVCIPNAGNCLRDLQAQEPVIIRRFTLFYITAYFEVCLYFSISMCNYFCELADFSNYITHLITCYYLLHFPVLNLFHSSNMCSF